MGCTTSSSASTAGAATRAETLVLESYCENKHATKHSYCEEKLARELRSRQQQYQKVSSDKPTQRVLNQRPKKANEPKDFDSVSCTPVMFRSDRDELEGHALPTDMSMTIQHRRNLDRFLAQLEEQPTVFRVQIEGWRKKMSLDSDDEDDIITTSTMLGDSSPPSQYSGPNASSYPSSGSFASSGHRTLMSL
mmetsp:Transcript_66638/g.159278  ORF Transcript_66638/g.159278 Transcript_66638/m.159278 type:complete len:192 (+) Transcript_66638:68-643(+)